MKRIVRKGKLGWGVGDKANIKIKNATKVEYEGIKFRSKLEANTYRRLKEEGFNEFQYEYETYTILSKFEFRDEKIREIKITPDFVDPINKIIIEVKGFANEAFPLRWKLFKHYLHINRLDYNIYIVKTIKELEELIFELKKTIKNE